jgi:hypothetical protein
MEWENKTEPVLYSMPGTVARAQKTWSAKTHQHPPQAGYALRTGDAIERCAIGSQSIICK